MELIFCGKRVARTVFVLQKYFSYFRILVGYVLIWYARRDGYVAFTLQLNQNNCANGIQIFVFRLFFILYFCLKYVILYL